MPLKYGYRHHLLRINTICLLADGVCFLSLIYPDKIIPEIAL
jgi:hypothetical protein